MIKAFEARKEAQDARKVLYNLKELLARVEEKIVVSYSEGMFSTSVDTDNFSVSMIKKVQRKLSHLGYLAEIQKINGYLRVSWK